DFSSLKRKWSSSNIKVEDDSDEERCISILRRKPISKELQSDCKVKVEEAYVPVIEKYTERWEIEAEMIIEFSRSYELCMNVVCALHRQNIHVSDYRLPSTPLEIESDEVIKSSVEKLVLILSEYEVTSNNKRECDVPVCEDSSTFDDCEDHFEILSDSNNDDISSNDDSFKDIEYVEASPLNSELVSLEEENDDFQGDEDFNLEDILQIQDVILREKLLSINRLIADIEYLNDNPTPDRVLNSSSSFPIFKKSDNSYSDNSLPELEDMRNGSTTTHANNSLLEYDSFCFEIEPDQERLTSIVMKDISVDSSNDPLLIYPTMIEASRVWCVVPIHLIFTSFVCKDCAKITKKQSKPGKIEHKIAKIAQKPDSRTFSV
nr:fatty acid desaturase family protein [Tanacetum cinerariifolium]